jgi:hypothetical protein
MSECLQVNTQKNSQVDYLSDSYPITYLKVLIAYLIAAIKVEHSGPNSIRLNRSLAHALQL